MINAIEDVSTGTTLGFISNHQMNCDNCEFKATSTNDMENLMNQKHKVKELSFVNDVTLNWNMAGTFKCHLCEYGTNKADNVDEHLIKHLGFISSENVNTWLRI